jgi:hypothetical protein
MSCLDIVGMVVCPRSSHPLGIFMVWDDVVAVGEFLVADGTSTVLLDNFAVQQFPHLRGRPEFPISSRVMRIFDPPNAQAHSPLKGSLVPAATKPRSMNRTVLVATEFHRHLLANPFMVWLIVNSLEKEDNSGWLDALRASGYYRAGNCGSANCLGSRASHCGSTLSAIPKFLAAAVPWSELSDSAVNHLAATPLSLVGG